MAEATENYVCDCESSVIHGKVTIVGGGMVGISVAVVLLAQNVTNNLCIIDIDENRLMGEVMDLNHSSIFLNDSKIVGSSDYAASADSSVCIIAAGKPRKEGETRDQLAQNNADIIKSIIPQLKKHSPGAILIVLTNPVDAMTYLAWKLTGWSKNRVIGTGTSLEVARLRFFLSEKLNMSAANIHACVIGEHGDTAVPIWSLVNMGGVRLNELDPNIALENISDLFQKVKTAGADIIKKKGYTNWAIALTTSNLIKAILTNSGEIIALSTLGKDQYSINDDIFLSLPCVVNANGVADIIKQPLTSGEEEQLTNSVKALAAVQQRLTI